MHDSGAALAESDEAPLARMRVGARSSAGTAPPPAGLLDTRMVRTELTRMRGPRQGSRTLGPARVRIARLQGASDDGRVR